MTLKVVKVVYNNQVMVIKLVIILTVTVCKDDIWIFASEFECNSFQIAVTCSFLDKFPNLATNNDNSVRCAVTLQYYSEEERRGTIHFSRILTAVDPVKATLSMSMWWEMAQPAV